MKIQVAPLLPPAHAWLTLLEDFSNWAQRYSVDTGPLVMATMGLASFWDQKKDKEYTQEELLELARDQGGRMLKEINKLGTRGKWQEAFNNSLEGAGVGIARWCMAVAQGDPHAAKSDEFQQLALRPGSYGLAQIVSQLGQWSETLPIPPGRVGLRKRNSDLVVLEGDQHPLVGALLAGSWEAAEVLWSQMDKDISKDKPLVNNCLWAVLSYLSKEKSKIDDFAVVWTGRLLKVGADTNQVRVAKSYQYIHHNVSLIFPPFSGLSPPVGKKQQMEEMGWDFTPSHYQTHPKMELTTPYQFEVCPNDVVLVNILNTPRGGAGKKWVDIWARHWKKNPPRAGLPLYGNALDAFFWHFADEEGQKFFVDYGGPVANNDLKSKHRKEGKEHLNRIAEKFVPVLAKANPWWRNESDFVGWSAWDIATMTLSNRWHEDNGGKLIKALLNSIPEGEYLDEKLMGKIVQGTLSNKEFKVITVLMYSEDEDGKRTKQMLQLGRETIKETLELAISKCHPDRQPDLLTSKDILLEMIIQAENEISKDWEGRNTDPTGMNGQPADNELSQAWKTRLMLYGQQLGQLQKLDEPKATPKM